MTDREAYIPGPAEGARIRKDGAKWTLILVRDLRHPPEKVWRALTEPEHLAAWAPFDADGNLGTVGARAKLTTAGAPGPHVTETRVTEVDPPKTLAFDWGGSEVRWELEPTASGTRLTLWTSIDPPYISMGAAGWHVCIDVMDRLLAGKPIGRIVAADALRFSGWQRLNAEYAAQFDLEAPGNPTERR